MNIRLVGRMVSSILFVTEVFMIPSLILCCIDGDHDVAMAFLASMAVISLTVSYTHLLVPAHTLRSLSV